MTHRPDEAPPDLDARGARPASADLERVLAAARSEDLSLRLRRVLLDRATVEGGVSLDRATVERDVCLRAATVEHGVVLRGTTVEGRVFLDGATVGGEVLLDRATVKGGVVLFAATLKGNVFLRKTTVEGRVFLWATINGDVFLHRATVKGDVVLDGATVEGKASLGLTWATTLSLAGAAFTRLVSLDVTAKRVELSHARFLAGLTARVGEAEVVMERVEMQGPAVLAGAAAGSLAPTSPPRLLQLAGTDVASLTLTGVYLHACRFSGAINLDKLRIDGSPQLGVQRDTWQARRRVIIEELEWRRGAANKIRCERCWYYDERRPYPPGASHESALARRRGQEIAAVYRALRKGREDGKDEPGAADFYYGEMEMRRKAAGGSVEGLLLTGYWLLSGYGLRAWRALTALLILIAAALLFATVGLGRTSVTVYQPVAPRSAGSPSYAATSVPGPRPGWATALNYSVQSTTSLLRSPPNPPPLTGFGQTLEIFLRYAGPGLLALAVLALRARVKR